MRLAGKVAIVTGGGAGIGRAIAEALGARGATVAVHYFKSREGAAAACAAIGGRAAAFLADLTSGDQVRELVRQVDAQLGPIDILVNNATFGPYRRLDQFDQRTIARTLESSVGAPLHLVQLALPDMRAKRRGWILNISSATAKHPQGPPYIEWERVGGSHLYASGKAALDRLTTGLAAELHSEGVAVNALAPVAAVITEGVRASGAEPFIEPSMIEPIEAMAEAALALVSGDPEKLTGRVAYSLRLLEELGREIRTLDRRAAL